MVPHSPPNGMRWAEAGRLLIGVNASHHSNRLRFTVAHELGHLVLHADKKPLWVEELVVFFCDDASSKAVDPREIEANRFAARLLMTLQTLIADLTSEVLDLNDDVSTRRLASRYQVSVQALERCASGGLASRAGSTNEPSRSEVIGFALRNAWSRRD